jgi:glycosyltransferase involved in cell wall biosynthesis
MPKVDTRKHGALVLIDATPLRADSGLRGIGRYVRDLLHGLAATQDEWSSSLRIEALFELDALGHHRASADLIAAADEAFAARGTEGTALRVARRLQLDRVAALRGARLLHVTEAVGTPLWRSVPRLVTCHDMIELVYADQYLKGPARAFLRRLREIHRYADARAIVAISERSAEDLVAITGVQRERVRVVLHGIDLAGFGASDTQGMERGLRELGLRPGSYVFYAGGADWRKNVEGMLQALAVARRRVDVSLVWAGALRPKQEHHILAQARRLGLDGQVRLLGFVAERMMPALFRGAAAHVFLSRLEGFGLSVVEAMAAGCPVIVARASTSDEIVADAGIVVGADDAEAAGAAIARLVLDESLRAEHARRGRARAVHFGRERMARDYARLYRELACSASITVP